MSYTVRFTVYGKTEGEIAREVDERIRSYLGPRATDEEVDSAQFDSDWDVEAEVEEYANGAGGLVTEVRWRNDVTIRVRA